MAVSRKRAEVTPFDAVVGRHKTPSEVLAFRFLFLPKLDQHYLLLFIDSLITDITFNYIFYV